MTSFNPGQLARTDRGRLSAYKANLDFYQGSQWEKSSTNRQLVFNYARVAIDKLTSYLMQGLTFACYPNLEILNTKSEILKDDNELKTRVREAEQLLLQVYQQNNLQQLDWETEIDAAVLGDGCYKVIWDAEEKRIRVTAPDVSGIFAWWLGDDMAKVWRVASRYRLSREEVEMLYGGEITTVGDKPRPYEKAHTTTHLICQGTNNGEAHPATPLIWQGTYSGGIYPRLEPYDGVLPKKQVTITELWTDKQFELYLDNDRIQSKPNPYGFIPFVIFPNNREPKKFWGTSDIPAVMQPQRELNRALSQLSRILELSGNPIVVLENVTSEEGIKINPGAVWTLPEDAKAMVLNLLEGSGIRLHIDYIDVLYRCLHDISETPRAAYGGVEKELSGAALSIEMGALIQKVTRKRTIRTNAYHQRNQLILKLAEKYMSQNFEGITHRVVWGPILPADKSRQAQDEQLLVQAGVHSRRTAMDEMGVQDPESEFARWLEERKKILEMNREFRAPLAR